MTVLWTPPPDVRTTTEIGRFAERCGFDSFEALQRWSVDDLEGFWRAVADFYRTRVPVTNEVVLTSGANANLVDSLVAGSRARLLVLTSPSRLSEDAAASLQSTPLLETVSAVGGTGALPAAVLTQAARS